MALTGTDSPGRGRWRRTSPFAIVHFAWTTAKGFADGWGRLATYLGITAVLLRYRRFLAPGIAVGMLTLIVVAVLRWWCFRFRVAADRIQIRQGVVKRTSLDIPFDRVQGINVNRRPVERVVGLVTVVIDTPGTVAAEGRLPSVHPEVADRLLGRVEAQQGTGGVGETVAEAGAGTFGGVAAVDGAGEAAQGEAGGGRARSGRSEPGVEVLQELTAAELVRMGLARPPALLLLALPLAYGVQLDDWVKAMLGVFDAATNTFEGSGILAPVVAAAVLGTVLLVLGLAAGVGRAFVRHHGFTVWRDGTAFRSRAGLFTRRQVAVRIRKVQQLRLAQSPVYRWFRRYRLACPTIGMSPDAADDADSGPGADGLDVPFADAEVVEELRSRVFSREGRRLSLLPEAGTFKRVSRYYMRARALRVCLVTLPAGVGVLLFGLYAWFVIDTGRIPESDPDVELATMSEMFTRFLHNWGVASAAWAAACILLAIPVAWRRWRRRGYMYDEDGLCSRSGLLGYKVEACLFRKAQEVTLKQSPLQRRHGLATLDVGTACGSVSIPYIDHDVACRLRDYVLHRAESSHRRWQ